MRQTISMEDIAREFNVSKVTVSKALNDKEGVSDELKQQIKARAEEMGYRFNNVARSLRTKKSYNIGLLIAERYIGNNNSYYFGVCGKLISRLNELTYSTIMETLSDKNEIELKIPLMCEDNKIDGLIIVGQLTNCYLDNIKKLEMPILFYDFYTNDSDFDSIIADNFFSGYSITNLLIENGHKEIGFIGNLQATSSIQDRFLGCYRAMLENKIEMKKEYIVNDRDDEGHFINLEIPKVLPTAFVCNNDEIAFYLIKSLKSININVPEDCSVVSFDDTIYSTLSTPQITTVDNNVDEMVNVACKVILKKIENMNRHYDRIHIKGSIIERDSVKKMEEIK